MAESLKSDLEQLISDMDTLVRRAYGAGYQQGTRDLTDKMVRVAAAASESVTPSRASEPPPPPPPGTRMSPPRNGLVGVRDHQYGSVIGTVRQALLSGGGVGMTTAEISAFCSERHVDVTPNSLREVIKRLRGGLEMQRRDGLYYPGPRLTGHKASPSR